jgi:hypothetical protein
LNGVQRRGDAATFTGETKMSARLQAVAVAGRKLAAIDLATTSEADYFAKREEIVADAARVFGVKFAPKLVADSQIHADKLRAWRR